VNNAGYGDVGPIEDHHGARKKPKLPRHAPRRSTLAGVAHCILLVSAFAPHPQLQPLALLIDLGLVYLVSWPAQYLRPVILIGKVYPDSPNLKIPAK